MNLFALFKLDPKISLKISLNNKIITRDFAGRAKLLKHWTLFTNCQKVEPNVWTCYETGREKEVSQPKPGKNVFLWQQGRPVCNQALDPPSLLPPSPGTTQHCILCCSNWKAVVMLPCLTASRSLFRKIIVNHEEWIKNLSWSNLLEKCKNYNNLKLPWVG